MSVEMIKFKGIDHFNRPIFKSVGKRRNYFGALYKLFDHDATESEVLSQITESDLCFVGNSFGCEPEGFPAGDIKIVRS